MTNFCKRKDFRIFETWNYKTFVLTNIYKSNEKTKKSKPRVKIFKNMGENIPGGNFLGGNFSGESLPGGSLIGGNFQRRSFPDTEENICEEFSSVHSLILIFITKIFILQTHRLRV